MTYYLAKDGNPTGPYSVEQLKMQNIVPDTLLWNESMPAWTRAGDIPELQIAIFGGAQPVADLPNGGYVPCDNIPSATGFQPHPVCPKTWLVEAILVTLFCCLPFGIVAIVKASKVSSSFAAGDYIAADQNSRDAGKWVKISFGLGLLGILLYILFIVVLGAGVAGLAGGY